MDNKKYKIMKDCFFNCYKSFLEYITISNTESTYSILVLKKEIFNNLSKVTVIIKCFNGNNDIANEFSNNVILSSDEATNLIQNIREDFKSNHYIAYSGINTHTFIQTLQNTKLTLNIKLNNSSEYQEAINFNSKINCDSSRHRALTKK